MTKYEWKFVLRHFFWTEVVLTNAPIKKNIRPFRKKSDIFSKYAWLL